MSVDVYAVRVCAGCGTVLPKMKYQGNPRKWCSERCRLRAHRYGTGVLQVRSCVVCGGQFSLTRSDRKYCSERCTIRFGTQEKKRRRGLPPPTERNCLECGVTFTPAPNNVARALRCSTQCARQYSNRFRRAVRAQADYEDVPTYLVFERDGWRCQLCGDPIDPSLRWPHKLSATLDHKVPLSRGGSHTMGNCQAAHASCNSSKGARWW